MQVTDSSGIAWKVAPLACRAMLTEAAASPKPGLVDRYNSGAHSDMDFFSFIDSSAALFETFYRVVKTAADFNGDTPGEMFETLRETGLEGEKKMLYATLGVNTHKGLIFSLGLLCAACGFLLGRDKKGITPAQICRCAGEIVKKSAENDLAGLKQLYGGISPGQPGRVKLTTGEKLFIRHGIKGARGEAAGGFPSALKAYKIISDSLSGKKDFNLSLVQALMHIMTETEDTNIPGRKDLNALEYVKKTASSYIESGGVFNDPEMRKLKLIDRDFISQGISPGGCADILAQGIFLYYAEREL